MSDRTSVLEWLLDSDPSLRWQVMQDLAAGSGDDVAAERGRVATEGWGALLLERQDPGGTWDDGTYRPGWVAQERPFFDAWTATHFSLQLLQSFGLDQGSPEARRAVGLVRDSVRWDADGAYYFEGETEECVNGIALRSGAHFGQDVDAIVDRLLDDQLDDGGWNCWSEYGAKVGSFHPTICVVEGLREWESATGGSDLVVGARRRGEEYLLDRGLFRRRSTGSVADPRFTMLSFPHYWYYDVLRALDHLRLTGSPFDERCGEAVELVSSKQGADGRWPLENRHQGSTYFRMDGPEGDPSRWVTLKAMRVLDWAGAG